LALSILPFAATLIGVTSVRVDDTAKWGIAPGGLVSLVWLFAYGMKGDLELRAAAESWPRLQKERQARYEYQLTRWRAWFTPLSGLSLYLTTAGMVLAGASWKLAVPTRLIEGLIALTVFLFWIRPRREMVL
jgi:hypothetical protein